MSKRDLSPDSLEAQADALLAAADSMDIPDEIPMPGKSSRSGKAAKAARPEADHIMTDEEAKKASIVRLDDKQVAALPAASWLMGQEKLRELLARGKKKGKLDSGELMETVDDLNLESDQMDQLYDSLEALNIDIGTEEDLLPELPDDEPAAEEIADVEEEELVDPNSLVSNFSIDDPVRMYLKEIGKVNLLSSDEEIELAQAMGAGAEAKEQLAELEELSALCRRYDIPLYLDGARLAYGLAAPDTDVSLADIARLTDAFYIGGTKCGALCGEAGGFPRGGMPRHFLTHAKQHGALLAKGRLLGVQFDTLFTDRLYDELGRHAIAMADELRRILREAGCTFFRESPTNQQFVVVENGQMEELAKKVSFGFWEELDETHTVIRFATSWATRPESLAELERLL